MRIYGECTAEREEPVRTIYSKTLIVSEKEEGSWVAAGTQSISNLVFLHLKVGKMWMEFTLKSCTQVFPNLLITAAK